MSSSKFSTLLYLLSFVLLFKAAFGYGYLYLACSSTEKFTTNDPFDTNLRHLAEPLPSIWTCALFVALMSPMKIAGAVFLMQAKIFSTVAQIPTGQPYGTFPDIVMGDKEDSFCWGVAA
ncbi:hypothetical protein FH972_020731 [Carpinus fangiana]|uniref:Uncharacterized protein n=1 Tax=Carpinus fangiana TaxID=176857 RepID=A0A5N6RUJ6_9ROSI|nr:hypothetical protein FH972_020731 [Carpinus fangiana]